MPEWLTLLVKFALTDAPRLLRRHLSQTIVMTIVATLIVQWLVIGPWGSARVRNLFLSTILVDKESLHDFGVYKPDDKEILAYWQQVVSSQAFTDDVSDRSATAVHQARYQAQKGAPPFQPLGTQVVISSPSCANERPKFGKVYMNMSREDLRDAGWKVGQVVRMSSQGNRGDPVIASIEAALFQMPANVQFHVNRVQYQMLHQWEPSTIVMITPSKARISQTADDTQGDVGPVRCVKREI